MTLVVARCSPHGVSILTDSRVVDPRDPRPKPLAGTLKAVIIDAEIAVGFAGNIAVAQDAIDVLLAACKAGAVTRDLAVEHLLHAHRAADGETDFIVASLTGSPTLAKISEMEVEQSVTAAWLGSHEAFTEYQRRFLDTSDSAQIAAADGETAWKQTKSKMSGAFFTMLIEITMGILSFEDVGDFPIAVSSGEGGFKYRSSVQAFPAYDGKVSSPAGEWVQVPIGGAAEGGYSYAVMAPREPGVCAVGVHFAQGSFGILMSPAVSRDVIVIEGVGHREFIETVRGVYGYRFFAPRLNLGGQAEIG